MKRFSLFLLVLLASVQISHGQIEVGQINKPVELLNYANADIENGNYESAVQKLIAAARLEPKIREIYLSLNKACSYTNQTDILKQYLIIAITIFDEDDEICYDM